jgi:hypothetical protein
MTIEELKARRGDLLETAKAIQAKADAEKRDMTDEETTQLEGVFAEAEKLKADIGRRETLASLDAEITASEGRQTAPARPARNQPEAETDTSTTISARTVTAPIRTVAERGRYGWHNFGDFAWVVLADPDGNAFCVAPTS